MSPLDVHTLTNVLEGLDVPLFAPVEIFQIEGDGPLRVVLDDDVVTITNDSSFPGEQLWPAA